MADIEQLIITPLKAQFPAPVRVTTELPGNLQDIAKVIQPARAGGPRDRVLDRPRVVIHTWATADGATSARIVTRQLAYAVDDYLINALRGTTLAVDGPIVTDVQGVSGPTFVPDQNTLVRHFAATYALTLR